MFEYSEFNIAPWGWEITVYFFLIGTAAMTFVYAAAPAVFGNVFGGVARSMEPFQKIGMLAALVLLMISGPLLIIDLGVPERFLYPILYFHWTSPLSWGALFLPLFGLCIVGFLAALWTNRPGLLKPIGILGMLLSLSMPLYTGLDLMVHQTRELWNNPTIPVLFVILSVNSGTALVSLVQLVRGQFDARTHEFLHWFLFVALGTTLALFLGELVTLMYGSEELQQAWTIINSQFAVQFWLLTFLLGILLPMLLMILTHFRPNPVLFTLAAVLAAVGAYFFRTVLIVVGQLTQIYF
ncbi:NrfD/PsrC family molybdoenzyme membrane anchor subunit [uncultured Thiocystis sp.]|jgi:formate-dependent nitrite reductase membrane component NrfD|uniref:NrfD/PsrC family molybdoenzyme membrane anchor subunit n=1 Tax=uncultured Thiocystis sp. TaxID=1202134 RepID=UPI0025DDDEAC|nr:NrfD/PsrC family molybdoenzyme membrane anchor subunit [uncultured Thiocystis sp.]